MKNNLHPLAIRANPSVWQICRGYQGTLGALPEGLFKQALMRDENTCQFCGFRSVHGMVPYHLDDDHENNTLDNVATSCAMCHMMQHLGFVLDERIGYLIYLPELSQAELNNLIRTIHLYQRFNIPSSFLNYVENCHDLLMEREQIAKKLLDASESGLATLKASVCRLKKAYWAQVEDRLKDLKIVFKHQIPVSGAQSFPELLEKFLSEKDTGMISAPPNGWDEIVMKLTAV